jgi:hypothetical protein
VTHEKKKKKKKKRKNKNKRQELLCCWGELGCGGSHTFKVIVVKKQNCKKFLLKINMHGSLLASLLASSLPAQDVSKAETSV